MGNSKKKHSVTHFLIGSFIGLIVFSIMVFSMLGIYMSRKSNKAINEVAQIYPDTFKLSFNYVLIRSAALFLLSQ